ncbi:MAG: tRNA(Ile)(2)-agmatinylcytidine synthase [Ignisphaera sp.]
MSYKDFCCWHLGLDDFDLLKYGCTTHLATYILNELQEKLSDVTLLDYPNLVRLNPSIPWKTRGNGAVAIRFCIHCDERKMLENGYVVLGIIENIVDKYVDVMAKEFDSITPDFEPGLAIIPQNNLIHDLKWFYEKALTDIVIFDEDLKKRFEKLGAIFSQRYSGRGVVGALAAVAWIVNESDYTYELLTYRSKKFYEAPRCVDEESIKLFDSIAKGMTFNNYDYEEKRALIIPRGFDPILYGVRGENPNILKEALNIIKTCEPMVAWTIFRSNQATDAHAIYRNVSDFKPFRTGKARVVIASEPYPMKGGVIVLKAFDATGEILLAFFRPSHLNRVAKHLKVGDYVEIQGHAKKWGDITVLHIEKISILRQTKTYLCKAPKCLICGSKMSKKGFGKGYKCEKCGFVQLNPKLSCTEAPRQTEERIYLPPPHSQKHLIKPIERYGKEHKFYFEQASLIQIKDVTKIIEPLQFL